VKELREVLSPGYTPVVVSRSDSSLVVKPRASSVSPSVLKPTSGTLNTVSASSDIAGTRTALDQIYTPLTVDISAQAKVPSSLTAPTYSGFSTPEKWVIDNDYTPSSSEVRRASEGFGVYLRKGDTR